MPKKKLYKRFLLQQDQYDCGVVCLHNILAYYKAEISVEKIREWSGTGLQGTSMLGLYQAALQAGFNARGAQAENMDSLKEVQHPCILHITVDEKILHYVVCYPGQHKDGYLVGDPAKGVIRVGKEELNRLWKTKNVLLLEPGEKLATWQQQKQKKLGWLWRIIKADVHLLYIAIILGLAAAVFNLSTAVFSQELIDRILPAKDKGKLFTGLLLLGFLLVMKTVFSCLRQSLLNRQGYQFNTRLTGGFYSSILFLNKSFFDNRKTGDLIARLNDTLRIQQAVSYILGDMAIQLLMLLASLFFLFFYSFTIGLICLVTIAAIYGVVKYFEPGIVRQQRNIMMGHAHNESNYVDSIRGIHTIKVMNRENVFIRVTRSIFSAFQEAVWKLGKTRVRFNAALEIVTILFLLFITGLGAIKVLNGAFKTGELVAVLQLAGLLMQTTIVVAMTSLQVQEAKVALDRMYEFTTVSAEYTNDQRAQNAPLQFGSLSVMHVAFRFPGKSLLLKDISLNLQKGEIIAITGESGMGKSTLFQLLQKFYPYEGSIVLNNQTSLEKTDTAAWRKLIGVVPQDIALFSGTVLANICLDPDEKHVQPLYRFCLDYGFDSFFQSLPQGYHTLLGEGGIALSGGQKQLLALARCLYGQPQLLLLDEPTAAMDGATEQFVIDVLQRVKMNTGIIIISHKDSLTQIADSVYYIQAGVSEKIKHPLVVLK